MNQRELFELDLSRVKLVKIPMRRILDCLYNHSMIPEWVEIPKTNLPEGFVVVACHVDPVINCVVVTIQHPDFDPVPLGSYPMDIGLEIVWERHALATRAEVLAREPRVIED